MRSRSLIAGFVVAATAVAGACDEPTSVAGVTDNAVDSVAPRPPDLDTRSTDAELIAQLETPTGSTIEFLEVDVEGERGLLVAEQGAEGKLVVQRIFDLAGEVLGAADLYASLLEAAGSEGEIPRRLADFGSPSRTARPAGWALDALKKQPDVALAAAGTIACNNATFGSSNPYSNPWKWLDTGPSFDPSGWIAYYWDQIPTPYYWTWARFNNVNHWYALVCAKKGYHPNVVWGVSLPRASFQYRSGGSWVSVSTKSFWDGPARTTGWHYYGGTPRDWRIVIDRAYVDDEFDLLMSKLQYPT